MELRSTPKLTEIHQCWYFFSNLLFSSCVVGSWVARWVSAAAAAATWVFGLGMWQRMVAWVLGLSRVGMGSSVMVWAAASRRDVSLTFSISLSSLPFFSFFSFFLRFWLFRLILESTTVLGFLLLLLFFFLFYIYIYIKVFMGSWKLLSWPAGIGMVEVRGPELKIKGAELKTKRPKPFFLKILHTKKKKNFGPGPP